MPEEVKKEVVIRDFGGLLTNSGKLALPAGMAAEQVNAQSLQIGALTIRQGIRECEFDD